MRTLLIIVLACSSLLTFSQDKEKEQMDLLAMKKANDFVHEGNELITDDNHVAAEMEYRKAISEQPNNVAGTYNLGNSYYKKGNYDEALYRHQQAAKNASSKADKHKAFHNIGNILMKNKQCKEAVEAYKSALRNDPTDEETRYNLVIAKECAEQQDDNKNKDQKDDKKEDQKEEENKDEKEKKDQENKDQDNKGDQDKKEGEDQKDKGKPEEDKQNPEKGDEKKEQQQQPQPGQLSPQQIKNLLEAMNNQEQKTQEKINAEKAKGVKVRTEKDW